jgi:hypothetical protein
MLYAVAREAQAFMLTRQSAVYRRHGLLATLPSGLMPSFRAHPLGPSSQASMTSSSVIRSRTSQLASYLKSSAAGSARDVEACRSQNGAYRATA